MSLSGLRKWWRRPSAKRNTPRKKPYFRKCFLEILEDRTLLSSTPPTFTVNLAQDYSNSQVASGPGPWQTGPYSGDLRWCVYQANQPANAGSTIVFDTKALGPNTLTLTYGELAISQGTPTQPTQILGPGASALTISGGNNSRVFDITSQTATVIIAGLTIANGNASPANVGSPGNQGGDLFNSGNLTLNNDVIQNGFAQGVGGGGIFNAGAKSGPSAVLTLNNTIVQNNTAQGAGSGSIAIGGGIYNDTNATLNINSGSQIINNQALGGTGGFGGGAGGNAEGGGIYSAGPVALVGGTGAQQIVIADNVARGGAGGNGFAGSTGFSGPKGSPGGAGGGGGSAGSAQGGGIYTTGTSVSLQYVNFLGNQAVGGGGGTGGKGGTGGAGTTSNTFGTGGTGGNGGAAGSGGNAEGGGIYNGIGALTMSHVVFNVDAGGRGNQALGGSAGGAGVGGVGGQNKKVGGAAGNGGLGAAGGFAIGGAIANDGGDVALTTSTFTTSVAKGGSGSAGGAGGNGSVGGKKGFPGGKAGNGAAGGAGGLAQGGAIANQAGNLASLHNTFAGNQALGGSGGAGGAGGVGGNGGTAKSPLGTGGSGGRGADGANGGSAQGGGFFNLVGKVTIDTNSFTANGKGVGNQAVSGNGGNGGNGGNAGLLGAAGNGGNAGNAGNAGLAEGGAGGSQGGNTSVTASTFTSSLVQSGAGGNGGSGGIGTTGGNGGNGGYSPEAFGGALAITASNLTVGNSTFGASGAGNRVIGGAGGSGGDGGEGFFAGSGGSGGSGADVYGGAISAGGNIQNVTIAGTASSPVQFANNSIISGAGGAGGQPGRPLLAPGTPGSGGNSGVAYGGALSYDVAAGSSNTATSTVSITNASFSNNSVATTAGGNGGANPYGGPPGVGGNAGTRTTSSSGAINPNSAYPGARGGGLAIVNEVGTTNLSLTSSSFDSNRIAGGAGGGGGPGGSGSDARGGAIDLASLTEGTATLTDSPITNNVATAGSGGQGGGSGGNVEGGGLAAANYTLTIQASALPSIAITGNKAASGSGGAGGGNAGMAAGGGIAADNSVGATSAVLYTLSSLNVSKNTLTQGNGGAGSAGGGTGGNAGFTNPASGNSLPAGADGAGVSLNFLVPTTGTYVAGSGVQVIGSNLDNNSATAGKGGTGGQGTSGPRGNAGGGGSGGWALGGGLFVNNSSNAALSISMTNSVDVNGNSTASGNTLTGGAGGDGGNSGTGGNKIGVTGGSGGAGGNAEGGGVFLFGNNSSGTTNTSTVSNTTLNGNTLTGGTGGAGGAGSSYQILPTSPPPPKPVPVGTFAAGGAGGWVEGGGLYNMSSNNTASSSLIVSGVTLAGNSLSTGQGGDGGTGTTINGGPGGNGGAAGDGTGGGLSEGGAMINTADGLSYTSDNTQLSVFNSTIGGISATANAAANGNFLIGANGGRGGNAGIAGNRLTGANGGNGGAGSILNGAGIYEANNNAAFLNDTIVENQNLVSSSHGAGGSPGGAAGTGQAGSTGADGAANGGGLYAAGIGIYVGNNIIDLNGAPNSGLQVAGSFQGLDSNSSSSGLTPNAPPDTQGAVGPNSYVETVNQSIALFGKTTGTSLAFDSLADFWTTQGGLARVDSGSAFVNPAVVWDEQIQRFIVTEQDVDTTTHVSTFDIAVSKSANPATLTAADWNFFQVNTTEANFDAENPGNLGWNHDALVFTLNMVGASGAVDHVQVNSIAIGALTSGTALTPGTNAFQADVAGANLRPTVMHDSQAGDPMWFVEEGGDNASINVVEMTNGLSATPTFTTTNLKVNAYSQAVPPVQPNGSTIGSNVNSSIQKVAEQNGLLAAAQTVSDSKGDEDNIQWYVINVSSGTPTLQQQGDVSGGVGTYDAFPSIDINPQGDIGMTFIQSGKGAGQFMSMYVTGRLPTDAPGTMATPLLVQAGQMNYADPQGGLEGDLSSIGVDSDGSFWAANEFANTETKTSSGTLNANWGTAIARFTLANGPDAAGAFTSLGTNILGSTGGTTGFNTTSKGTDMLANAAQLNLGPLQDNGGATPTNALLNNSNGKSIAIDAGGNTLVTKTYSNLFGANPTDQRGPGFPRLDLANNKVDIGAYEYDPPVIAANGLSPSSAYEQGSPFVLTISGTGFTSGAVVNWVFTGDLTKYSNLTLTPTSITGNQITVLVPTNALPDEGTVNLSITEPDGSGLTGETMTSVPVTFTINESPTLTLSNPGTQNNNEGDTVNGPTITSSDPDTTFSATGLPTNLSIDSTTGVISGTIGSRAAGTYSVTVYGTDDGVIRGSVTFAWNVADTTPPALTNPGTQNNNEGDSVNLQVQAVDADPGTFSAAGLPTGLSISSNGLISGTIDPRGAGTYQVTVSATDDGYVGSTTFAWVVADTTPPTVTNPGNQTNNEGDKNVSLAIQAVDADSFTLTGILPSGLTFNSATGVISGNIGQYAAGSYTLTVTATDNGYVSSPVTFTWTVNDTSPPSFTISNQTSDESAVITNLASNPVDADPGSITDVVNGLHTLPPGLTIDPNTGVISGTIDPRAAGTYTVTISATDGTLADGTSNVGSTKFTWIVNDTTPPAFTNPGNQTSNEGYTIPGSGLAIDPVDADPGTVTDEVNGQHTLPPGLTIDPNTGVISGTIDPYAVTNGSSSQVFAVTISASDNGHSSNITFNWTVNDTTPPTLTTPANQTNNEGDQNITLAIQAQDAESFAITGLPTGLTFNANTGVISGNIDPRGAGIYTVTVTGYDGALASQPVTFTWTVNDTTPPALTNPGTQNNNEGDTASLQIQSVDADPGSFTVTGLPPGLTMSSNGLISGTIDPRGTGTYKVTVSATDNGYVGSTTFTWNVADTTPPALTNPGTQNNNEGDAVKLAIQAVDADSFTAAGLPKGLSIDATTGVISGTIDPYAANGAPYTVTVFASDNGNTSSVTFTWNVADTTPPALTNPGTLNNNESDVVNLSLNPVDADPGTIIAIGLPPGLSINSTTGVISGTIAPHSDGSYLVAVSASDNGNSTSISFLWNVADSNPPTLTNPGTLNSNQGAIINMPIQAVDADSGSFRATGLPGGLSIDPNTGIISGTVYSSPGTYHVAVSAADGNNVGTMTFNWVVNQMPTANVVTYVHNSYVGLFQIETVTASVTNPAGLPIQEGYVTFQVNGEFQSAPVFNGLATATFVTPMFTLDIGILLNDFFTHTLDAVYSDPSGIFGYSAASVSVPAMLLDLLVFFQTADLASLALQLPQLQS